MKRRCRRIMRRLEKGTLGLIFLAVGLTIVAIIILPYTAWMFLLGLLMIFIGYKLFI